MPDWLERTIKTFIQAFFGTLIPELCAVLNKGFPDNWPAFWAVMAPFVAAALSAGICAAWNIMRERLDESN